MKNGHHFVLIFGSFFWCTEGSCRFCKARNVSHVMQGQKRALSEAGPTSFEPRKKLKELETAKQAAVAVENYNLAGKLRDEINDLNNEFFLQA